MIKKYLIFTKLLTINEKKTLFFLFFFILSNAFIEVISIGSIFPLISIILDPENFNYILKNNDLFKLDFIFSLSDASKITILTSLILLIFFFKNLYFFLVNYINIKFSYSVFNRLCEFYFTRHFHKKYQDTLNNTTSYVLNNILNETGLFVGNFLKPLLTLFVEITVLFGLIILLVFMNFQLLFFFTIILISSLIFFLVFKGKLKKWAYFRSKSEVLRHEKLLQGLYFFKELNIFNLKDFFFNEFKLQNNISSSTRANLELLQTLPKLFLEIIFVISFLIYLNFQYLDKTSFVSAIPMLALFAITGYRIVPSVNKILSALNQIKFGYPSIENLYKESLIETRSIKDNLNKKIKIQKYIFFKDISFKYSGAKENILENINIKILKKDFIGIVGPSGIGKSTFIDIILGFLEPTKGKILIDGKNDIKNNLNSWQSRFSYIQQKVYLMNETIETNITFSKKNLFTKKNLVSLLVDCGLDKFTSDSYLNSSFKIGENGNKLSEGQKQKLAIARALFSNREILILDEATSALDSSSEEKIFKLLKNVSKYKTIIFITHNQKNYKFFKKIFKISEKKIIRIK
jgi:ABC-type multidrug transport system fused ATPase/permease subunit